MRTLLLLLWVLSHQVQAQPAPQHHWPLDEQSGTLAQDIVGGAHGLLAGGPVWAPAGGYHGGSLRCDGVDDRVLLGACDLTNGGDGLTLSLWFKPDFVTAMDRTLIAKANGTGLSAHVWSITLVNATALRLRLRTGGTVEEVVTPPSSLFGGQWYHVAATYTGSQVRLYLNGSLMASTARTGSIGYHPSITAAAGALPTGTAPFSGWIDDVRIYPVGLTEAQVLDLLMTNVPTVITEAPPLSIPGNGPVAVHDLSGRLVWSSGVSLRQDDGLPPLPPGLYVVSAHGLPERRVVRALPR